MLEIFNGGTVYSAAEIEKACNVFQSVSDAHDKAIEDARSYANSEAEKLTLLESIRFYFLHLGSGRTYWERKFDDAYKAFELKYDQKLGLSCAKPQSETVRQLRVLAKAKRDCYLNPDQVNLVEKTRQYWDQCQSKVA